MATFVAKERSISLYDFPNCVEARAQHPRSIDTDQTFLISGHSWAVPMSSMYGPAGLATGGTTLDIPFLLRPWTEYVAIALQAVVTTAGGTVDMALMNEALGAAISLQNIVLSDNDLGVNVAPVDLTEWSAVPMHGCGSLGYNAPAGGKGALQVTPSNSWVKCWLRVVVTDAALHTIYLRTFASPLEVT